MKRSTDAEGRQPAASYKIEAHWGLARRRGRNVSAHVYWLDDKAVGTTIGAIQAKVSGPPNRLIAAACIEAKSDGRAVYLISDPAAGWVASRTPFPTC